MIMMYDVRWEVIITPRLGQLNGFNEQHPEQRQTNLQESPHPHTFTIIISLERTDLTHCVGNNSVNNLKPRATRCKNVGN